MGCGAGMCQWSSCPAFFRGSTFEKSMTEPDIVIRPYQPSDEAHVIDLWQRCNLVVPWNDPKQDILRKVAFQPHLFWVGEIGAAIVATVMAGYEGHRGWINYLAVSPEYQRRALSEGCCTWLKTNSGSSGARRSICRFAHPIRMSSPFMNDSASRSMMWSALASGCRRCGTTTLSRMI